MRQRTHRNGWLTLEHFHARFGQVSAQLRDFVEDETSGPGECGGPAGVHGDTSKLTTAQLADLVTYLESL